MSYTIPTGDRKYTYAEYMAMEEVSTDRHDFYHGEIFATAGGTKNHNNIILTHVAAKRLSTVKFLIFSK